MSPRLSLRTGFEGRDTVVGIASSVLRQEDMRATAAFVFLRIVALPVWRKKARERFATGNSLCAAMTRASSACVCDTVRLCSNAECSDIAKMMRKQPLQFHFRSEHGSPAPSPRSLITSCEQLSPKPSAERLGPRPKHTLLSPVPRKTARKQVKPHAKTDRVSTIKRKTLRPNLQKGFRLLRTLFTGYSALEFRSPLHEKPPTPLPEIVLKKQISLEKIPSIVLPEGNSQYNVRVREPSSRSISPASSISNLLDLESGVQTPRRRPSILKTAVSAPFPVKVEVSRKPVLPEEQLIPVMRITHIDSIEFSDSSEEEIKPRVPLTRRSSQLTKTSSLFRKSTYSYEEPVPVAPAGRRLSVRVDLPNKDRSLMTSYQLQTAEMLSDTQFRMKGLKAQRVMPQRYFKNLC